MVELCLEQSVVRKSIVSVILILTKIMNLKLIDEIKFGVERLVCSLEENEHSEKKKID